MTTVSYSAPAQHGLLDWLHDSFDDADGLRVHLAGGITRELSKVRIGRIFVYGLLEDNLSWCLIRLSSVTSLAFHKLQSSDTPGALWTRKSAGELLRAMEFPAEATIGFRQEPRSPLRLVVLGVTRGLIATDSYTHPYVPLAAISYLELNQPKSN